MPPYPDTDDVLSAFYLLCGLALVGVGTILHAAVRAFLWTIHHVWIGW